MFAKKLDNPLVCRLNRLAKLPDGIPPLGEKTDLCQTARANIRMDLSAVHDGKKRYTPRLHSVVYQFFVDEGDWDTLEKRASSHRCPKSAELSKQGLVCLNPGHLVKRREELEPAVNRKRAAEEEPAPWADVIPDATAPSETAIAYVRKCIAENHFPWPIKELLTEVAFNPFLCDEFKKRRTETLSPEELGKYKNSRIRFQKDAKKRREEEKKIGGEIEETMQIDNK